MCDIAPKRIIWAKSLLPPEFYIFLGADIFHFYKLLALTLAPMKYFRNIDVRVYLHLEYKIKGTGEKWRQNVRYKEKK